MTGFQIEGHLDNITDKQVDYIKDVLEEKGYKDNKVLIESVSTTANTNVKRITVEDHGKTFKMIAKIAPTDQKLRDMTNTTLLFENEITMYTKVLPIFDQFQIDAEIPEEQRLRYAACYGILKEDFNEVILLEDLNESNYKMLDMLTPLSNECIKSLLKNFAILHSLSFALKHKEPALFNDIKESLSDLWSTVAKNEELKKYFYHLEPSTIMMLERDEHKNIIQGIIKELFKKCVKLGASDPDAKSAVILHGDPWINNIMIKKDGENLIESILIDYKASKVSNPVSDLLYMLFNCTDYYSRKEHFYDWIDYYHKQLDDSLNSFGLKASCVFSRDQLDVDLKRYGKLNLGLSIVLSSVQLLNLEEAKKLRDTMEASELQLEDSTQTDILDVDTLKLFRTRVEGLIDSKLELGFL